MAELEKFTMWIRTLPVDFHLTSSVRINSKKKLWALLDIENSVNHVGVNPEANSWSENLSRYLEKYDTELRGECGDGYSKKLSEMERMLQGLPIAHSTNLKHIDNILQSGLQSFISRREKNYANSAIFEYDHQYGLSSYVFASIGYCPLYGNEKGRITILMDDSIRETAGFFTFHDLTWILLASEQRRVWEWRYSPDPYADRIREQFHEEKLPLLAIYQVLARTFLKNKATLDDFFRSKYLAFPPAYDPDFQHTNGGAPEIKIPNVDPRYFIGYVVKDNDTKQALVSKGIPEEQIILSLNPDDEKRLIYEYKSKYAKL